MASGRKNYFRHSFFAHEDPKLQGVIDKMGFEGYGYYFSLLELCGRICAEETKNPITFHLQSLRNVWRKQSKSCVKVLKELSKSGLFVVTFNESLVELDIPNFAKYLGRYQNKIDPNTLKKRKEKKRKEKKRNKISDTAVVAHCQKDIVAPSKTPKGKSESEKNNARRVKNSYCDAYRNRYGIVPVFAAKEHSLVYRLLSSVGFDEAMLLAAAYPNYNDPWHIGQKHPFALLVNQLSKVRIELDNPNRMLDSTVARKQIIEASEVVDGGKSARTLELEKQVAELHANERKELL
jgi:hypothetical protein